MIYRVWKKKEVCIQLFTNHLVSVLTDEWEAKA